VFTSRVQTIENKAPAQNKKKLPTWCLLGLLGTFTTSPTLKVSFKHSFGGWDLQTSGDFHTKDRDQGGPVKGGYDHLGQTLAVAGHGAKSLRGHMVVPVDVIRHTSKHWAVTLQ
jgi:hypothetical protein